MKKRNTQTNAWFNLNIRTAIAIVRNKQIEWNGMETQMALFVDIRLWKYGFFS